VEIAGDAFAFILQRILACQSVAFPLQEICFRSGFPQPQCQRDPDYQSQRKGPAFGFLPEMFFCEVSKRGRDRYIS
jgi:hypothetical protein